LPNKKEEEEKLTEHTNDNIGKEPLLLSQEGEQESEG